MALTLTITVVFWNAASPVSGLAEEQYDSAIQKLREAIEYELQAKKLPAFSMALVDGKKTIWSKGFGFQDADRKRPATADTVYRVGSVSKLFTDIAVMQLVEQGKLDLRKPIQAALPSFDVPNESGVPITLEQLMSHRAGLVRESPVGHYFDPTEPTLEATVASLNKTALVYTPNTRTKYSNAGVAAVGAALEHQVGVAFTEHMQRAILEPLDMKQSSFRLSPQIRRKLATAWMWTYDDRRFEAPTFALGTAPAGNLYSSVNDLAKFLVCLFNNGKTTKGQLVTPATLNRMLTPQKDSSGKPQGFGIGFHVQELDGHKVVGHGGAVYGFSTQLEALPARRLGVAAVCSLDGSNGVTRRLTDYALRLMLAVQDDKPLPSYRTTSEIPPERARKLVGRYQFGGRQAAISELNGRVFLQHGVMRQELRAANDNGAIVRDDTMGFVSNLKMDDEGNLRLDGQTYTRQPVKPPAAPPKRWQGLIGEYGWDHNTLYILEDQGNLVALIEWFFAYPLTEINENEFAFPDYGLYHGEKLKFSRNDQGVAERVVAAEVEFFRREVGTRDGETFKIQPLKPIDELRKIAMDAKPPLENGAFRSPKLVELNSLDPSIKLDIRYASTNNFTGSVFYKQPRAFMQRPAAEAVVRAHQRLKKMGLGLLIHDAYRPWHVTKMFWDATPGDLKDFVANPANGSRHNRGCAVDLTLYDLASGKPIQMVAGYDEFSPRSFPNYPGGSSRQRWYRELLRRTMQAEGFTIYEFEWWHFDYQDWKKYQIGNATFEELLGEEER